MIELTLEQLLNSIDSLKQLSTKSLKARVAFTVARIIKDADVEVTNFNETRSDLIAKYGEKNEDGSLKMDDNNNVQIIKEQIGDFNKELMDLLKTKISLNANKMKVDDLDALQFTPAGIIALEPFIESEE